MRLVRLSLMREEKTSATLTVQPPNQLSDFPAAEPREEVHR